MNKEREARIRALRKELRELELQDMHEGLDKLFALPKEQWFKMIFEEAD